MHLLRWTPVEEEGNTEWEEGTGKEQERGRPLSRSSKRSLSRGVVGKGKLFGGRQIEGLERTFFDHSPARQLESLQTIKTFMLLSEEFGSSRLRNVVEDEIRNRVNVGDEETDEEVSEEDDEDEEEEVEEEIDEEDTQETLREVGPSSRGRSVSKGATAIRASQRLASSPGKGKGKGRGSGKGKEKA